MLINLICRIVFWVKRASLNSLSDLLVNNYIQLGQLLSFFTRLLNLVNKGFPFLIIVFLNHSQIVIYAEIIILSLWILILSSLLCGQQFYYFIMFSLIFICKIAYKENNKNIWIINNHRRVILYESESLQVNKKQ